MEEPTTAELSPFQVAVLVLSLFVLAILAVELVVPLDPEVTRLITWIDHGVCAVLLIDFVVRFRRAESKLEFLRWGWIDLLASIPAIETLRWGRALRVLRVLRVIRAVRSLRALFAIVFHSRATGGVVTIATIAFLTLSLASLGILVIERPLDGSIDTAEDALWWSLSTVTTVGYGDVYPVSGLGRAIAACLMVVGVGLFGTLSGAVASVFVGRPAHEALVRSEPPGAALTAELASLRREIASLRAELEASRASPDEREDRSA